MKNEKKILGSIRGLNTGPLANVLRIATLSENHTTRPTELGYVIGILTIMVVVWVVSLRNLNNCTIRLEHLTLC